MAVSFVVGIMLGIGADRDWFFIIARQFDFIVRIDKDTIRNPLDHLLYRNNRGELIGRRDTEGRLVGSSVLMDGRYHFEEKVDKAWFLVELESGSSYVGFPRAYDQGEADSQIYLTPACQRIDGADNVSDKVAVDVPVQGPGILIPERVIRTIVVLDKFSTPCYRYWDRQPEERDPIYFGVASAYLDEHGYDQAIREAFAIADRMHDSGDLWREKAWLEIARAIEVLHERRRLSTQ